MSKIIAVTNQKGGVGKTTSSINLSAGLGNLGKKVLLIDIDPQANATNGIGIDHEVIKECIFDVLVNETNIRDIIKRSSAKNVDVAPASINLAGADIHLMEEKHKENKLKNALNDIEGIYDYIIIDCPPSLGLLNTISLTAADGVLIPLQAEHYALEGIKQLLSTIQLVQRLYNKKLGIEGILLTMYDSRTNLSTEVAEIVRSSFKERAYKTFIPRNVSLAEAPAHKKSIFDFDSSSKGAKAYAQLAGEVVEKNG